MARITVEDCLANLPNRFTLVRLASRRTKQILAGSPLVADSKGNREIVSALREIAKGKIRFLSQDEKEERNRGQSDGLELPSTSSASLAAVPVPEQPVVPEPSASEKSAPITSPA